MTSGTGTTRTETSAWNLPNTLTVLRLIMVPVFAWVLLSHPDDAGWRWAAAGVFSLAILTDSLDGHLARKYDLVTSFGKLADPIADKALTGMAFIGLSIIGELWWWVTVIMLVREWGITIMRFVVLRYGVMAAGRGGKIKTVLQAVAVILYLMPLRGWWPVSAPDGSNPVAFVIMMAAFAVTVITGLDYIREAVVLRRSARPAARR